MTGPLPDPRDPARKSLVRVVIGHGTTTESSGRVDLDAEVIADAVREFALKLGKGPWDVTVTNEVSPGHQEDVEPHDPEDLHRFWTELINRVDLYIVHPLDNGSTGLGELVRIAMEAPGRPLIVVPDLAGVKVSKFWRGQVERSTRVKFLKIEGRGKGSHLDLDAKIKEFLFNHLDDLEGGPERRRLAEVAMLADSMELERRWHAAPSEVRGWIAQDLCMPDTALHAVLTDPLELASFGVLNYMMLVEALQNPDTYTVGRGHSVLKATPMRSWDTWSASQPTAYSLKVLRHAIVRTERALAEVSTPVVLDQMADWVTFAHDLENGR